MHHPVFAAAVVQDLGLCRGCGNPVQANQCAVMRYNVAEGVVSCAAVCKQCAGRGVRLKEGA